MNKSNRTPDALLQKNGQLRISAALLPEGFPRKGLRFAVTAIPEKKQLELQPVTNGNSASWPQRKAGFSNTFARSPQVFIKGILKSLDVKIPRKSVHCPVTKKKDGTLVVQF